MKRTALFGMLGALAAIPCLAFVVLTLLLVGLPSPKNMILPVYDARLYHFLMWAFQDGRFWKVSTAAFALWAFFISSLAWRLGFLNKGRLRFWRIFKEYPRTHGGGIPGMLARMAVVALLSAGGYLYLLTGMDILDPDSLVLLMSSFRGPFGRLAYMSAMSLPALPLVFSITSFAHAAITSAGMKEFRGKVKAPLLGVILLGVSLLALDRLYVYLDMDKGLNGIPGLTANADRRSLMMLEDPPASLPFKRYFYEMDANPKKLSAVAYCRQNEEAVKRYLAGRGNFTCLRGTAYDFLIECRIRELDVAGAMPLCAESFITTRDPIGAILAITRINVGEASEGNRKVLAVLSDETRYWAGGMGAMKLGRAYARFGDLDRARYWYNKGVMTNTNVSEEVKDFYAPPKEAPYSACRIRGRITLDGVPAVGVRVGVTTTAAVKEIRRKMAFGLREIHPLFNMMGLADGTGTGKDGYFSFDKLGENDYIILLSLEDTCGKQIVVLNSPGVVPLSKGKPAADVGTIRLLTSYKGPVARQM